MKNIFLLSFILLTNLWSAPSWISTSNDTDKDMTNVSSRASDLDMDTEDYTFAMAISGVMSGSIFGLFLWKVKLRLFFILLYSFIFSYSSVYAGCYTKNSKYICSTYLEAVANTYNSSKVATLGTATSYTSGYNYGSGGYYISSNGSSYYSSYTSYVDSTTGSTLYDYTISTVTLSSSCADGLTAVDGVCTAPTCSALSDDTVALSESQCTGTNVTFNNATYGSLTWQYCDSTCYGLEVVYATCDEIGSSALSSCDTDLYDFSFECTDGSPSTVLKNSCTKKNKTALSNPCDTLENSMNETCKDGYTVTGSCSDNGMIVTNNTFKCTLVSPDCSGSNMHLDVSSNACACNDGYSFNTFGDCWTTLDDNASDEEIEEDLEAQEANHENETSNNSDDSDDSDDSTTNDSLAGIRSDLDTTNELLNDIKDTLNADYNSSSSDYESPNLESHSDIMGFINTAKAGASQIESDFNTLYSSISGGIETSDMSVGSVPVFSVDVFNTTIELPLCDTFSKFYDIFYYVFSLLFLYIGIRIFIFAFMIGF